MKFLASFLATAVCFAMFSNFVLAGDPFSKMVGDVPIAPVKSGVTQVPYIVWGGDVATFRANGGLQTKPNTIFAKHGLNLNLVPGDDFVQQVRDFRSGKSPYLRGTTAMMGLASQVLNQSPDTKPVVILHMTWSAGDHIVGTEGVKNLNQLKGKKIALQQGGPHLGLLDDALKTAGLSWNDITPVWCKDLTGTDDSPSAKFRAGVVDAACVISPDMIGLTGGLTEVGSGAEGNVKGSHVVVSTASMSRSIADVYAVRSDFYRDHRDQVEKFVAGYLKSSEEIVADQKAYNDGKGSSPTYLETLKLAQSIYGEAVLPTIDVDAHGLLLDCTYVRLPGNVAFFSGKIDGKENLQSFDNKMKSALDLAVNLGYVTSREGFEPARFDYRQIAKIAGLDYVDPISQTGRIQAEVTTITEELDANTIASFVIQFEPNQNSFSIDRYGAEFRRVLEDSSRFGNAVFVVRGHADPTATIKSFLSAGIAKGVIRRTGSSVQAGGTGYKYFIGDKPLNLDNTPELIAKIKSGEFSGAGEDPYQVLQAAQNLSLTRAEQVKKTIVEFAQTSGINLDESQIQPQGVGIKEPVNPRPTNMNEAAQNMRVEFRLIRVSAEALKPSDFDF